MKKILTVFALLSVLCSSAQKRLTMMDISKADIMVRNNEPDKALEYIAEIKNQKPVKDSVYMYLIMLRSEINRKLYNFEEAYKDLEEVRPMYPTGEHELLTGMANMANAFDVEKKIALEKEIIAKYPDDKIVYNNLANTYCYLKNYSEALMVLNSNPSKTRFYMEDFQYAKAYYELGQYGKAKEHIEKYLAYKNTDNNVTLSKGPDKNCLAYKLLAKIYAAQGNNTKSCESITQAAALLDSQKELESLDKLPEKVKAYNITKYRIAEFNEIATLKDTYCK
jgi:tetratricopeptide (TPR) repeat protein